MQYIFYSSQDDLERFFCGYIGRLSKTNEKELSDFLNKIDSDRIWCASYFSEKLNWFILDVGIIFFI